MNTHIPPKRQRWRRDLDAAVRKEAFHLRAVCEANDLGAQLGADGLEIDVIGRRQHEDNGLIVGKTDDGLCDAITRGVFFRC
jgi:hypothetical protein